MTNIGWTLVFLGVGAGALAVIAVLMVCMAVWVVRTHNRVMLAAVDAFKLYFEWQHTHRSERKEQTSDIVDAIDRSAARLERGAHGGFDPGGIFR